MYRTTQPCRNLRTNTALAICLAAWLPVATPAWAATDKHSVLSQSTRTDASVAAKGEADNPVADLSARKTLSVNEAHEAAKAGQLILIDIRRPDEWQESGIPDVALAMDMTDRQFIARLQALRQEKPDKPIAFICAVGGRSHYLVSALRQHRFGPVIDVPAGMHTKQGWLARQLPVRKQP